MWSDLLSVEHVGREDDFFALGGHSLLAARVIDQLDPTASAFSVTFPIRLGGLLDVGALGRALTEVSRRHEILRTTFPVVDGRPLQRISPMSGFTLEVVDLSALRIMDSEADRLASTALERTLDLIHGPLAAAVLLRRDAQDHTLLLTLHHILFDGWSAGILLREVAAFYQGSALPDLPIQYGDFAVGGARSSRRRRRISISPARSVSR
ncbi:MAG TPA: condensation domain-containing protein [Thermoanaerobaculia bacterium]